MTIFETLINRKIPFAVVISLTRFKNTIVEEFGKDYCIIISQLDVLKADDLGFHMLGTYKYLVAEKTISKCDYDDFKKMSKMFEKVQHNEFGRVYELKSMPFKKYLEAIDISEIN
jgi:hypothetical protein